MSDPDPRAPHRPMPRCMRIVESRVELPHDALALLVSHLRQTDNGAGVGKSELESFALHTWRLGRRVDRMDDSEERLKRQLQDSHRRLADALAGLDITIEDPTERAYTDGWLEVDVIAWEEPEGPAPAGVIGPWVKQTIRPVIRNGDELLCKGEIVVADPGDVGKSEQLDEDKQQ